MTLDEIGSRLWVAKEKASEFEAIAIEMILKKGTERLGGKITTVHM